MQTAATEFDATRGVRSRETFLSFTLSEIETAFKLFRVGMHFVFCAWCKAPLTCNCKAKENQPGGQGCTHVCKECIERDTRTENEFRSYQNGAIYDRS
jgi:hypothetical protein